MQRIDTAWVAIATPAGAGWLAGWSELIGLYFESCQEYENIFVLGPKVIRSIRTHLFRINEEFIGAISVIYMGG